MRFISRQQVQRLIIDREHASGERDQLIVHGANRLGGACLSRKA
jgi:hypothetical protein